MNRGSYKQIHDRLEHERGRAVGMPCVAPGCTRLADGWGLRSGEATHFGEDYYGRAVKWSTDLAAYSPMCMHHNRLLDGGGDWDHCPRGHYRATFGTYPNGQCRGCSRSASREHRRRAAARAKGIEQ